MQRIAVFPGSFDPITKGHENLIIRGLSLFDKIIVAVGNNGEKNNYFNIDQRMEMIRQVFKNYPQVEVAAFSGLTVDFCKKQGVRFLLRGLRTSLDFEYERAMGHANKELYAELETIYLLSNNEHSFITSSLVRDVLKNNGDPSIFLPESLKLT